jgi:transposase
VSNLTTLRLTNERAPKFVALYRLSAKRGKNDAADAAAICEAVTRPSMRFVPPKSLQQQAELMVHRARQGFVQQRTATISRIRSLLSEFGIVLPLKAATVRREAMQQLEDLPGWANTVIGYLLSEVHRLDEGIAQYDRHIEQIAKESAPACQLMQLPGVGATRPRHCWHDRRRPGVQVRAAAIGLARSCPANTASAATAAGAHHQGGLSVLANALDPRRTLGAAIGQRQD